MSLNFINSIINTDLKSVKIEINIDYGKSKAGILKSFQIAIGLICFIVILHSCYYNYDPYLEDYTGFVGGKSETAFILVVFACFLWTSLLLICFMFSVITSTVIPKTIFEIVYHSTAFILYSVTSLTLLIEVAQRNTDRINDISEPGFAGKITASVFGLINSIAYSASMYFAYKAYNSV